MPRTGPASMAASFVAALALTASLAIASPVQMDADSHRTPAKRDLSFDYNNDKVRGVNLGGWFVLEPWITPSIFDEWADSQTVVDEWTFCETLGQQEAYNRLSSHWNSWITESDFQEIASLGLNHVRIPIGYWAVAPQYGDPYVQGQLSVLDQAIGWARSAGLKILIDLHGAPGSQNGFDNSGHYGAVDWQQGNTVQETVDAVQALASRYASQTDVVTAIELLNEPLDTSINMGTTKAFYYTGWQAVRNNNTDTAVVIHDCFEDPVSYWNGFMNTASGVNNVILDTHIYQVFTDSLVAMDPDEHISTACNEGWTLTQTDKWTIAGEWTGAQTDCAKWLNGLGKGARYDGTFEGSSYVGNCDGKYEGTVDGMQDVDKYNMRKFVEAQMDAYEMHTGWIWWCWKTESAPEWHFQNLTAAGLIPQPLTDRQYPNQCGYDYSS